MEQNYRQFKCSIRTYTICAFLNRVIWSTKRETKKYCIYDARGEYSCSVLIGVLKYQMLY